ncbi:alkylation response protein AidB-like acyl-CoA dehydrogenase [Caulobacter ginsengisoli]|uniref:Alkylation response protein AidB-like acyl-CoA dehydrogenase n=1 Tax=Caulobacter ginsengisoli TaxID=400775 RepID=A0ABU0IY99_9CAUL|nr:acyl-CoA dehydrogenase family protein [Caulobacter ginsengisoli]MDQ0465932.1 alkylation response protein AidB-like acyl-CoA dehydrogenase [Caulobacter ginsengisoli]
MAVLTEEQTMLRDAAKSWTQDTSPTTALRKLRDSGSGASFDPAVWREMGQMGWAGVIVPEEYGGSAFGYLSLGLVLEETGRTLTASPLVSTALAAASALMLGGAEPQKQEWLTKIAAGEIVATLAVDEGPHHAPERTALQAKDADGGYVLNGKKTFVIDGEAADLLIVAARTAGKPGETHGITLFLVPGDAAGVTRKHLALIDSRGAAEISFDNVHLGAHAVLGELDNGWSLLDQTLDRARAGLAAEMLGQATQAFEITLDYLKTRVQFGQVIGTFQALQHRAAKMFTDLETTRSCVEAALEAIDSGSSDVRAACSLAKCKASELIHLVSNEMVQMHGGIGMTDAHDAGLYMKRARVAEALFGGASFHKDRYARLLGF